MQILVIVFHKVESVGMLYECERKYSNVVEKSTI